MPYDSVRVHAALFFCKIGFIPNRHYYSGSYCRLFFSGQRGENTDGINIFAELLYMLVNDFGLLKLCCQRPLITLQKGTYYIAICALLHCGMYAFALVLQSGVCRKYFC